MKNNGEISNEVSHFANGRETDADKRIFHMKFGFKGRRYDKDKRYYLVVADVDVILDKNSKFNIKN